LRNWFPSGSLFLLQGFFLFVTCLKPTARLSPFMVDFFSSYLPRFLFSFFFCVIISRTKTTCLVQLFMRSPSRLSAPCSCFSPQTLLEGRNFPSPQRASIRPLYVYWLTFLQLFLFFSWFALIARGETLYPCFPLVWEVCPP